MTKTELAGQTILVTGASGAIGAAIVRSIAADGATPIIHYARNKAPAEALLAEIGGKGFLVQADLSDPAGAEILWSQAIAQAGTIHALVNNAGVRSEVTIDDDMDQWQAVWRAEFQLDLFSAADLCKLAIQHFRSQGGGRIVNMASRAGQRGYVAEAMPYAAAKAALNNLTKTIARAFGKDGIIAIAVAPGWVRTEMAEHFIAQYGEAATTLEIPIGAMALPEEVADMVAFALRPSQRSLNGATLDMNGGSYLR